jgi:hypothetical protein
VQPSPTIEKPPRPPHALPEESNSHQSQHRRRREREREERERERERKAHEQEPRVPAMERDVVVSDPEAAGSSSTPASSSYSSFAETRVICRV